MADTLRIAAAQVSVAPIQTVVDFWSRMERLVNAAKAAQCQALLLPEYACLSLLVHGHNSDVPFNKRLQKFSEVGFCDYENRLKDLSHRHAITLVGATYPFQTSEHQIVNRGLVLRPKSEPLFQDKLNMTRFEKEDWGLSRANHTALQLFEICGVSCAMTICYDVEFSKVTTQAAAAGAEILFVPSCTDDDHSYWRVRHCAHARAVENQCFVVMASVIDGDPRFDEISAHVGQAGLFSPCDGRFPERGILAEAETHGEQIVTAELDFLELRRVRASGSVLNLRDQMNASG